MLTMRDMVTLLLAVEFTYLFAPLSALLEELVRVYIFNVGWDPPSILHPEGWLPPIYPRNYFSSPKWFLLTALEAKLYIALGEGLRVPGLVQCSILFMGLLFCFGSVLTVCAPNRSPTNVAAYLDPVGLLVNLFSACESVVDPSSPDASQDPALSPNVSMADLKSRSALDIAEGNTMDPILGTCVSLLSFESTRLASVRVYDIFLFCLVFHFGPQLVRSTADGVSAAKRAAIAASERRCAMLYARVVLPYAQTLTSIFGVLTFIAAMALTLGYVDGSHCQQFESGIFHPTLYGRHTLVESWAGNIPVPRSIAPLQLAWPEWFVPNYEPPSSCERETVLNVSQHTCDLALCCLEDGTLNSYLTLDALGNNCFTACYNHMDCCSPANADHVTSNQGVVCAISNVAVYSVAVVLIGVALACCTCVHLKLTGSTMLGAYIVQGAFETPEPHQDAYPHHTPSNLHLPSDGVPGSRGARQSSSYMCPRSGKTRVSAASFARASALSTLTS